MMLTIVLLLKEELGDSFLTEAFGGNILVETAGILVAFWKSKSVEIGIIGGSFREYNLVSLDIL